MDFPNQNPQSFQPPVTPQPAPQPMPTPPAMMGAPAGVAPAAPVVMPPMATPTAPAMSTPVPASVQIPVQNEPVASSGEDQVYTMPEKFLTPNQPPVAQKKKSHKTLTIILIGVIVLALLAIIGGVLFYVFAVMPAATQPAEEVVVSNDAATINTSNANNTDTTNTALSNTVDNTNDTTNTANVNNANDNLNSNTDANVNDNTNTITGITNDNGNVNTTTNDNTNTVTTTNTNVSGDVPVTAPDTDQDALTSEEEKIWGTKAELPDTDSDGYPDGTEIAAAYDPLNPESSGRLIDSGKVGTYANKTHGYSIYYPIDWVAEALSEGNDKEILFTPNTLETAGEFMEVIVESNPAGLTAAEWYSEQVSLPVDQLQPVTTFADLEGVWSVDGYTAYFATNNDVYAVSYHYGNSPEVNFMSTFTLMVKSFALTKKAQQANDAVNTNTTTNSNENTNGSSDGNTNNTNTTNN